MFLFVQCLYLTFFAAAVQAKKANRELSSQPIKDIQTGRRGGGGGGTGPEHIVPSNSTAYFHGSSASLFALAIQKDHYDCKVSQ